MAAALVRANICRVTDSLPFEQMVYVGDNAEKDFQAPKQLGMRSVWVQNKEGLYQKNATDIDVIQENGKIRSYL